MDNEQQRTPQWWPCPASISLYSSTVVSTLSEYIAWEALARSFSARLPGRSTPFSSVAGPSSSGFWTSCAVRR